MSHRRVTVVFLRRLQTRTAYLAIGRSTLRNQGRAGMVAAARRFLRSINLREFSVETRSAFETALDKHTRQLMRQFPSGAKENWGAARKSINIFLRDVLYNHFLADHYGLNHLEPWLELPLDSNTYAGLLKDADHNQTIESWPGVRHLTPETSEKLQNAAEAIAIRYKTYRYRVHLDLKYWRSAAIYGD